MMSVKQRDAPVVLERVRRAMAEASAAVGDKFPAVLAAVSAL